MTLGERIRTQRQSAGLSQEKLAELTGVSRQAVAKWEADRSAPGTANLFRLAEIFDTTVDLLLAEDEPAPQADCCAGEGKTNAVLRRQRRKGDLRAALLVALGYLAVYLVGRVLWCDLAESSLLGWLFTVRPAGEHSYLYGWLLSSRLFWYAMGISVLPACFGRWRFSVVTLAGFVLGLLAGMLFGPNPAGAALGQGHYGWLIWGVIYLLSIPAGIVAQRRKQT